MKNRILLFAAAVLTGVAAFLTLPATASTIENVNGYSLFSGTGVAQGTTNSYYVAGNYTLTKSTAVLRYANVTTDASADAGRLQFYILTNQVTISNPTNSGTTNFVLNTTTNGYTTNQAILIKHISNDTYERLWVNSVANTNQLITQWPPLQQCAAGDIVWVAAPAGQIKIPRGTYTTNCVLSQSGDFLYAGQYGLPLLMDISGTSAATINAVSGDYR